MSARSSYDNVIQDTAGNALANVRVSVYDRGTTDLVTIYSGETGGTLVTNPIVTGSTGLVHFWANPGAYDLLIHDTLGSPRFSDRTVAWEAISGHTNGGIKGTQIENAAINKSRLSAVYGQSSLGGADGVAGSTITLTGTGSSVNVTGPGELFVWAQFNFWAKLNQASLAPQPNYQAYGRVIVNSVEDSANQCACFFTPGLNSESGTTEHAQSCPSYHYEHIGSGTTTIALGVHVTTADRFNDDLTTGSFTYLLLKDN